MIDIEPKESESLLGNLGKNMDRIRNDSLAVWNGIDKRVLMGLFIASAALITAGIANQMVGGFASSPATELLGDILIGGGYITALIAFAKSFEIIVKPVILHK